MLILSMVYLQQFQYNKRLPARILGSTVGTVTEIYDYLRLLYARIGVPKCPNADRTNSKSIFRFDYRINIEIGSEEENHS